MSAGVGCRPVPARHRGRGAGDAGAGTVATTTPATASSGGVTTGASAVAAGAVGWGRLAGSVCWGADVCGKGEVAIVVAGATVDDAVLLAGGITAVLIRLPAQRRGATDRGFASEVLRKQC